MKIDFYASSAFYVAVCVSVQVFLKGPILKRSQEEWKINEKIDGVKTHAVYKLCYFKTSSQEDLTARKKLTRRILIIIKSFF